MKNNLTAIAAIIVTCFFWGVSYMSSKIALTVFTPWTLAFTRFFIASIALFILFVFTGKAQKIKIKDVPRFASAGIIGVALYFTFENNGIKLTSASLASMIIGSVPVFGLVGDCIVNKAKLTARKTVSVLLSVLGVFLIVCGNSSGVDFSGHFLGYIFMFGAAISWVTANFVIKPLYEHYSGLTITFYQILFGTIALAPFAIANMPKEGVFEGIILGNVLFLGLCCSAAAYFLYIFALNRLGIMITVLFVNFVPVITVISSFFFLHETVTIIQLVGGIIVILSVCLLTLRNNGEKAKDEASKNEDLSFE